MAVIAICHRVVLTWTWNTTSHRAARVVDRMRALVKRLGCATEPEKMPMGTLGEVHLLAIPHSVGHQFILRKFSTRQAVPKNIFRHEVSAYGTPPTTRRGSPKLLRMGGWTSRLIIPISQKIECQSVEPDDSGRQVFTYLNIYEFSENRGRTAQLWNDTVKQFQVTQKMCFFVIEACAGIHHHDCTT